MSPSFLKRSLQKFPEVIRGRPAAPLTFTKSDKFGLNHFSFMCAAKHLVCAASPFKTLMIISANFFINIFKMIAAQTKIFAAQTFDSDFVKFEEGGSRGNLIFSYLINIFKLTLK